jgi:arylsulfatase A-like enzyme
VTAPRTRAPNVLLLITDQERVRRHLPDHVRFEQRDRLAEGGLTFARYYVATALCAPSRSTMFTGRHTSQTKIFNNKPWGVDPMDTTIPTLGSLFQEHGYRTAYKGKWHLGVGEDGLSRYGFEDWTGPDPHGAPFEGRRRDSTTASDAADWLRAHADDDTPWLLVVSFVNPHDIMWSPRFPRGSTRRYGAALPDNFAGDEGGRPPLHGIYKAANGLFFSGFIPPWKRDRWLSMIEEYIDLHVESDRHLGTVLDALDDSGLSDDTLVVHTSDHGEMAGSHGLRGKGPFLYEENLHVPLVVRWPGVTPPGSTTDALASATDLVPTLLGATGGDPGAGRTDLLGPLPGWDHSALLADPVGPGRDACLFTWSAFSLPGRSVQDSMFGIFDGTRKLGRYFHAGRGTDPTAEELYECYDLDADPGESTNLADGQDVPGDLLDSLLELEARELHPT